MDESGFTSEDRKTLITVEVSLNHVAELLSTATERIIIVEKDYVHREELRAVEVDIDELRVTKVDKVDIKYIETTKLNFLEQYKEELKHVSNEIKMIKHDVEALVRWRWFERGIIATILIIGEFISHIYK